MHWSQPQPPGARRRGHDRGLLAEVERVGGVLPACGFASSRCPERLQCGEKLAQVCQSCHGLDGKGVGVMQFRPPAADLTGQQVQAKLDSGLYTSIHEGRANTAMGAWKYALSDQEIRDVIAYVRTFGKGLPNP